MALHRDILWIGRQWAVTGHGLQLIDQRLEGAFDIEVGRLWDDDLIESLRAKAWIKAEDFEKGLEVARTRHSQPQAGASPPPVAIEPVAPPPSPELELPPSAPVEPSPLPPIPPEAASPPPSIGPQESPALQMKTDGGAKFARPWRVWMKKKT